MAFPTGIIVVRKRFFSKVRKTRGCWLWTGSQTKRGYGQLKALRRRWQAHRLSWFIHRGMIPEGLQVLHRCDNPACVKPAHLFLGTHLDNIKDKVSKHRQAVAHQKLSPTQAIKILALLNQKVSYSTIAARFKVTKSTIYKIKKGKSWKHVHQ